MSLKEAILNAAEQVFATHGYDGTSMRLIAQRAKVAQALLHYHFKNKETLYAALFARRASSINSNRERFIDALQEKGHHPSLEDILEIMLMFPSSIGENQVGDYKMFQQIVSSLSMGTDARSKRLMIRYYDPIARRFIGEFRKALPELTERQAIWSYLFALGARQQAQAMTRREVRLVREANRREEISPEPFMLLFVAAGIRAIAGKGNAITRAKKAAPRRSIADQR